MTPDEVRMMDNHYALLFIRGERPITDEKYNILKHPDVKLTTDGAGKPYKHGEVTHAVASIVLGDSLEDELKELPDEQAYEYELLSDEDLEQIFKNQEEKHETE